MKVRRDIAFHKEIEFSDSGTFISALNDINDDSAPPNNNHNPKHIKNERKIVL
jgi:hypothetical protein